jgi:hypothetical protein
MWDRVVKTSIGLCKFKVNRKETYGIKIGRDLLEIKPVS